MKHIEITWDGPAPIPTKLDADEIVNILEWAPNEPGLYAFGRMFGRKFHPLYVGQAKRLKSRISLQLNNRQLIEHVLNAKSACCLSGASICPRTLTLRGG